VQQQQQQQQEARVRVESSWLLCFKGKVAQRYLLKSGVLVTSGKTSCLITIDLLFFVAFSIGSLEWLAKIDHDGVSLPIVLWKHPTQTDGGC
jgi:hypothetical protein